MVLFGLAPAPPVLQDLRLLAMPQQTLEVAER
jgi:hypothetical protein